MATASKRVQPDKVLFTYQGDGDLSSIGAAEIVHAAARSENLTVFFVNNAIYGMTGGQMAPTTLVGQKATTAPLGRKVELQGYPIRMSEMLSTLDGATYITRQSVHNVAAINKAKKAVKKAFEVQINKKGFSMVEILSTCPTNWGIDPKGAVEWMKDNMIPHYPLGDFKAPKEVE